MPYSCSLSGSLRLPVTLLISEISTGFSEKLLCSTPSYPLLSIGFFSTSFSNFSESFSTLSFSKFFLGNSNSSFSTFSIGFSSLLWKYDDIYSSSTAL